MAELEFEYNSPLPHNYHTYQGGVNNKLLLLL